MKWVSGLLLWALHAAALADTCVPGLVVANRTNSVILSHCNEVIDVRQLSAQPTVHYARAKPNDTYLLMMLQSIPNNQEFYRVQWLVSGVKGQPGGVLQTSLGTDLANGYTAPVNQTRYEFRLYNMTGQAIWEHLSQASKNFFSPNQWLAKSHVAPVPIASTVFSLTAMGPPGSVQTVNPPLIPPPQYPTPKTVYLPAYSTLSPPDNFYPSSNNNFQTHTFVPNHYQINGTYFRHMHNGSVQGKTILNINGTLYTSDNLIKGYTLSPTLTIDSKPYIWRNRTMESLPGPPVNINGTQYVPYNPTSRKEIHHIHHHYKGAASSSAPTLLILFVLPAIYFALDL